MTRTKFALFMLCLLFALLAQASGSSVRGGGDDVGIEFQAAYMTALEDIRLHDPDLSQKISEGDIDRIASKARIFVYDGPLFVHQGLEQDVVAINDPAALVITVSRPRWLAITDALIKRGLALHEVLSLARLESTGHYPISALYVSRFKARQKSLTRPTKEQL